MLPLTESSIRSSFINATQRERSHATLPDLDTVPWDDIDFLAWRDKKSPALGYVVIDIDGTLTGVMLKQAERTPRSRAQCSWCEDIHLPNDVVFYSAKRAGAAGRNGNTVGTLACDQFQCSVNARKRMPVAYAGFDVEAERQRRVDLLREHVTAFVTGVAATK